MSDEQKAFVRGVLLSMNSGVISYERAESLCLPYIEEANKRAAEIAKKYNKKPLKVNFTVFRNKFR